LTVASIPAIAGARHTDHADVVEKHPWFERLARWGYVVRGLIYLIPGALALRLAVGSSHGAAVTQTGAIELMSRELGRPVLIVVLVGLGAYSIWGVVRAVFDPLRQGHSAHGIFVRLGYVSSALGYAGFFIAALRLLAGKSAHSSKDWLARLLATPIGPWALAIFGLCWIGGAGIAEIVKALGGSFERDLQTERMSPAEKSLALWLGRFGIALRGLVFGIIGGSFVVAAWHADPLRKRGLGGALLDVAHQPYGRFLLATAALGLIAFGLFSILSARWARTGPRSA
jgi:uncharacterized protein DUF1206